VDPATLIPRLKALGAALSTAQLASLAAAFLTVVVVVGGSAYWLNRPDYTLLFADMEPEAASDVIARLKSQKVSFELDPGGRSIRVPASQVDELRLEFASQGLPSSGRIGFEIFDRTAFGATEFLEQVNYRRALEGEIARTIGTLSEVAGARVHIAMSRSSLFATREQPAKASVVLKLRSNRPLAASTAAGISNLVAASVEGLRPESVVILDTAGRPLVQPAPDESEPLGPAQMDRQQRIEKDLTTKVLALLEPVVGAGVRVNVSARLDPRSEEQTEETWDPSAPAIRSRQVSGDAASLAAASGIAGARGNLPGPTAADGASTETPAPATAPATVASRGSETVNYELSKVVRHTIRPRGDVERLSVAVTLDHETVVTRKEDGTMDRTTRPRAPEDLQKIHGLVAAAVGLDAERGDQLTVENVPFEEPPAAEVVEPGIWDRVGGPVLDGLRVVGIVAMGLFAFLFFVRPLMRRATGDVRMLPGAAGGAALPAGMPRTVADLEGEIEAQLDAAAAEKAGERRKLPVLTRRVSTLTQKEPEHAARLIRMWMGEDPR
jgi:flagellar M-ring protein FliF